MKRHKVFATLVVLGIVGLIAGAIVIAQQQTLTMYYPAPYGEYVDLTFAGHLDAKGLAAAPPLSNAGEGRIYFDNTAGVNKFKVSENGQPYVDLSGGGGPWTRDPATGEVTLTTPTDRVGIGTAHAAGWQFQVAGNTEILTAGQTELRVEGFHLPATPGNAAVVRLSNAATGQMWYLQERAGPLGQDSFAIVHFDGATGRGAFGIEGGAPSGSLVIVSNGNLYLDHNLSVKGGVITLEDSDGVGCTRITANDGVIASVPVACPWF